MVKYEQKFVKEGKVMKQIKILHCADLHFDTPFKELTKEISQNSKEELLQVFKNIIDLTINEKVQVLLIAGDVFDNLTVNKNTLFFISNQLKRIENGVKLSRTCKSRHSLRRCGRRCPSF